MNVFECACVSYYFLQFQVVLLCAAKGERKTKLSVHQLPKHPSTLTSNQSIPHI